MRTRPFCSSACQTSGGYWLGGFTATTPEARTILSRATDAKGQAQPVVPPWNPSGYLWNAPDTIRIEVKA